MSGVQNIQEPLNFPVHASTWGIILRCSGCGAGRECDSNKAPGNGHVAVC